MGGGGRYRGPGFGLILHNMPTHKSGYPLGATESHRLTGFGVEAHGLPGSAIRAVATRLGIGLLQGRHTGMAGGGGWVEG